jgi:pSer/pThr/pTyr-binding forkhead associated (FHA) protein
VAFRRRGDRVFVTDLGSKNGTRLGEVALTADRPTEWKPGSPLKFGDNVLSYRDPLSVALAELEQASDEPLPDGDYSLEEGSSDEADGQTLISSQPPPVQYSDGHGGASPIEERPRRAVRGRGRRALSTDILVGLVALGVLALSALGLFWLFGTEQ